ncbi:MAG TPA: flavin reductase family protein [Geminicoccus sp.]|uniref:flavin reductase family protein n=1 Tax=Geminicoccus sp. TaxID=2024832 RepID=UPI002E32F883|nr:flavin reductase family protein [Geminicoccus sp.]HEX2529437.1 flavin reductase family protein [Geminicoccus sp.]
MSADRTSYIDGMRRLAAGVTIVTTGRAPERFGLTATAVTSVSADPPTLLACINRDSDSFKPITRNGRFAVNVLGTMHHELAERFGGRFAESGEPRFMVGDWMQGGHDVPILVDAPVCFECQLETVHDGASHGIMVGRVLAVRTIATPQPLLWFEGGFAVPGRLHSAS